MKNSFIISALVTLFLPFLGCQQQQNPTVTLSPDMTSVTTEGPTAIFPCDLISASEASDTLGFPVVMDDFFVKSTASSQCGYYSEETGNGVSMSIVQFSENGGASVAQQIYEDGKQYTPETVTALPSLSGYGDESYGYQSPLTTDIHILRDDMVIGLGVSGDQGSDEQRESALRTFTERLLGEI